MASEKSPSPDYGKVIIPGTSQPEPQQPEVIGSIQPYDRKVGNWLSAYLEYTKESESPDNYHIWCALSSLSGVVRRNLFLDQGLYILFPNLYVALVGPPGRTAKSTALYLSKQLLRQVPSVKLGPDSCTREQLIKSMSGSKLNNQCAMTIYSTEFSSLIGPSGILMIQFLLDIYDCNYTDPKKGWEYQTKHQGSDELINPFLSMLVCTTPSYLAESIPDNIVGHGFTSRMIFVHEEKERLINPRPKEADANFARSLIEDLRHISHISGQFKWENEEAQKTYDDFYQALYRTIPEDHRLEGYHWRKKIHVLKVAMLLSLANDDSLLIRARDITMANHLLTDLEAKMARVFQSVGKYEYATDVERVGNFIRSHGHGVTADEVYRRFYHLGSDELGRILMLLQKMHSIVQVWKQLEVEENGKKETKQKEVFLPLDAFPWA